MNPRYYHTPPPLPSTRVRCPVCHEEVYSRAGIHPQCAVRQSEPPKPKKEKGVPVPVVGPTAEVVPVPPSGAHVHAAARHPA